MHWPRSSGCRAPFGGELKGATAAELLSVALRRSPAADAIDLVLKWSAERRADTVDQHLQIAEAHGAVWWGVSSSTGEVRLSKETIERLTAQVAAGVPTRAFLVGPTCWSATVTELTTDVDGVDRDLIPAYYRDSVEGNGLWVKLEGIEPTTRERLTEDLELYLSPGVPVNLANQQNPILVRRRPPSRVWWVNQGESFRRAAAVGLPVGAASREGRPRATVLECTPRRPRRRQGDLLRRQSNPRHRDGHCDGSSVYATKPGCRPGMVRRWIAR